MQNNDSQLDESVKFVRLSTGEDLISEVTEYKDDETSYYILINPLKVVYSMGTKSGILSVGLMQWVFSRICEDQEFNVFPEDVVTMGKPTEGLIDYYFGCVDHFNNHKAKLESQTQFEDEPIDESEIDKLYGDLGLNDIKDLMKDKKRKLH